MYVQDTVVILSKKGTAVGEVVGEGRFAEEVMAGQILKYK